MGGLYSEGTDLVSRGLIFEVLTFERDFYSGYYSIYGHHFLENAFGSTLLPRIHAHVLIARTIKILQFFIVK